MMNIKTVIDESSKIVSPAWPLKSFVAVNPFWNLKEQNFYKVLSELSNLSGQALFLPLSDFVEKYNQGFIKDSDIIKSMELLKDSGIFLNTNLETFIRESKEAKEHFLGYQTFCEFLSHTEKIDLKTMIIEEISKYCSSYFDLGQAAFSLKNSENKLYHEWRELIVLDSSMELIGFSNKLDINDTVIHSDPLKMIEECAIQLGLTDEFNLKIYIMKICHHLIGWCSHINFQFWQKNFGLYNSNRNTNISDIVAMFMYYECIINNSKKSLKNKWIDFLDKQKNIFSTHHMELDHNFKLLSIWQRSLELSYQGELSKKIKTHGFENKSLQTNSTLQMVFCIDVRSEVIRRKIEESCPQVSTYGFAGFFGVSLQCQHEGHEEDTYHCPVLLQPKIKINEKFKKGYELKINGKKSLGSFVNGMKQGLVSSFAYVEFFGMLSAFKILKNSSKSKYNFKKQFESKFMRESHLENSLQENDKIDIVHFVLTHLGIKNFSKVVIICGHGSVTTNNAFASALDCGACGGHSGDLNAKFLCELLNDKKLREELKKIGKFKIPENTVFIPAIHETVSDKIHILECEKHQSEIGEIIQDLQAGLNHASKEAQKERALISKNLFPVAIHRQANWSEVRPEWALARNASFIIAPRARTKNINLEGRAFLHDYDYTQDEGMKTLELIITAPMVVANWINMQYYASSVCPNTYGAGNKVIHNIEGLFGVVEGNSGDLKIGLPFQSVHDGNNLVHEPLRLSVFIEAPIIEIEKVIEGHSNVKNLVENQWLHIFALDRNNQNVLLRRSKENYEIIS